MGRLLSNSLLGLLVLAGLLQVWAPYYPISLALAAAVANSRSRDLTERVGVPILLALLAVFFFGDLPHLVDSNEFMDPIVVPRLEQLWGALSIDPFMALVSTALGGLLGSCLQPKYLRVLVISACVVTALALPWTFQPSSLVLFFNEPGNDQASDLRMLTKTFFLMQRNGGEYYQAFFDAYCIRFKVTSPAGDLPGFCPPLIFWEWYFLCKNMAGVFLLHQIHIVIGLLALYPLAVRVARDATAALVVPVLWTCYAAHSLTTPWWANSEHWVLFWLPLAWLFYFQGRDKLAMPLMVAAAFARAPFGANLVSPIAISWLWGQRRRSVAWIAVGLMATLLLAIHYGLVQSMLPHEPGRGPGRLNGGWWFVKNCILFNWDFLPRSRQLLGLMWLLGAVGWWRHRRSPEANFVVFQILPALMFFKIGYHPIYNYGMPFLPWICLLSAAALSDPGESSPGPAECSARGAAPPIQSPPLLPASPERTDRGEMAES